MNILNGSEAFVALMAGKKIMCRAVGKLLEFNDLDQFPATIFAMPGYEFSIKIDSIELAGITFLKPFSLDELVDGQEVCIVENFNRVTLTQFYSSNTQLVENVKAGFAQRDRENASKQLEAIQKVLGFENTIYLQKGYGHVVENTEDQPVETKKRQSRKKTTDTSLTIADVEPSGVESGDAPWENKVEELAEPTQAITILAQENVTTSEDSLILEVENTLEITDFNKPSAIDLINAQAEKAALKESAGDCDGTPIDLLYKKTKEVLISRIYDMDSIDALERLTPAISAAKLKPEDHQELLAIFAERKTTIGHVEPTPEHQEHLDAILVAVANAQTPIEVNAQIRYTKSWTEEQRKPVIQAINKRLVELAEINPASKMEYPSLMVRIQKAIDIAELYELEAEVRTRHPDIQPKLMDIAKQRRFELESQAAQVGVTS